jgi:hypothetical protein
MRWLPLFLSLALPLGSFAAKKSAPVDRFKEFHAEALSSAPVKLGDASYKDLTSVPRDYSVAVLLTAMENRFGCQLCREFNPEWELLAKSWTKGDKKGESRVVFATLDFSEGRDTFVSVSLVIPLLSFLGTVLANIPSLPSLVSRLPRFFFSSSPLQAPMPYLRANLFVTTLQTGEYSLPSSFLCFC